MNIYSLVNRGVQIAGDPQQRMADERAERDRLLRQNVVRKAREMWRNALTVDETRGWLSLMEKNTEVLNGLVIVLGLVAFAQAFDSSDEHPSVRVIRGAISAIQQAGNGGNVITHEMLVAVASAARIGKDIVATCTDSAIERAAHYMHAMAQSAGSLA